MNRRDLIKALATVAGAHALPLSALMLRRSAKADEAGDTQPFSYSWLKGHARALAREDWQSAKGDLPRALTSLSWDDYQAIRFRPEKALWRGEDSTFRIQLFHLGLYFESPVRIHEVRDGRARELSYQPEYFRYEGEQPLGSLPSDLGYAGFRVHFHTDYKRDLAAFLGASYFRAVGSDRQYGLSARGLAINTGLEEPEEFPEFTAFWLEKPADGSDQLVVYALLDSPSTTGAYGFTLNPGRDMVMKVDVALYPRRPMERVGIAPLTSMYQTGENDRRLAYDWRPEIHDSDGLAVLNGQGEWLWRPLVNPRSVRVNSFVDNNPGGFGLLQRDREFAHYQDDGVFYDLRPGAWVEPQASWGAGSVLLVEIPTRDETFDNIVAFWKPEQPLEPGHEYLYAYTLTWGAEPPNRPTNLATVRATRTGLGGVVGQKRQYFSWRFAVDFVGGPLAMLASDAEVEPVITASRGRTEISSARPLASGSGYRAMFDLVPDDSLEPIDLRLQLKLGEQVLTETWLYQYTPPPQEERELF